MFLATSVCVHGKILNKKLHTVLLRTTKRQCGTAYHVSVHCEVCGSETRGYFWQNASWSQSFGNGRLLQGIDSNSDIQTNNQLTNITDTLSDQ